MNYTYDMQQPDFSENAAEKTNHSKGILQRLKTDKITLSVFIITLIVAVTLVLIGIIQPLIGGTERIYADSAAKVIDCTYNDEDCAEWLDSDEAAELQGGAKFQPKQSGKFAVCAKATDPNTGVFVAIYKSTVRNGNKGLYLVGSADWEDDDGILTAEVFLMEKQEYYIYVFSDQTDSTADVWVRTNNLTN